MIIKVSYFQDGPWAWAVIENGDRCACGNPVGNDPNSWYRFGFSNNCSILCPGPGGANKRQKCGGPDDGRTTPLSCSMYRIN